LKTKGYPKKEKLKSKDDLALLFKKGRWFSHGNLRIVFYKSNDLENGKFGVSVAKRIYKKAVDRNRIKRLLREAYRLHKPEYHEVFGEKTIAMLFYISNVRPNHFSEVEEGFLKMCKAKK
jgi:ribonuclease P protein component